MSDESPLRERTKSYALCVIKLYTALPKKPEAQVIGQQHKGGAQKP